MKMSPAKKKLLVGGGAALAALLFFGGRASAAEALPPPPGPAPIPPRPLPPVPPGVLPVSAAILGDAVNLRAAPNENSVVRKKLQKGQRVTIINTNDLQPPTPKAPGGWYGVVTADNIQGYVSANLLGDFQNIGPTVAGIPGGSRRG